MLDDSQAQKWSELANSDGSIAWSHRHQISYTWFNRRSWSASAFPSARWSACSSEEYNPGLGPVRLGYCPTILRCSGSTGVHKNLHARSSVSFTCELQMQLRAHNAVATSTCRADGVASERPPSYCPLKFVVTARKEN